MIMICFESIVVNGNDDKMTFSNSRRGDFFVISIIGTLFAIAIVVLFHV